MTVARRMLVPEGVSRCYHCLSRCVRRAFLCGDSAAHRKDWIKRRLLELNQIFAIEVGAFAIMDNHLHLMVRTQPQWANDWSDEEVVRRWVLLYPRAAYNLRRASDVISEGKVLQQLAADRVQVAIWRRRLASLSWFMKCLKEPIARRANREDDVTGHFWEGRFKVQALLDEAAVLACLAYIDLNPIRAAVASTPEHSEYTSVQDRIQVRQSLHTRGHEKRSPESRSVAALITQPVGRMRARDEEGIWLIPIQRGMDRGGTHRQGLVDLSLDDYLTLIDVTGRHTRAGKRGAIPEALSPILERLDISTDRWINEMRGHGRRIGTAIGSATSLAREAARRGRRWIVGAFPIYTDVAPH